MQSYLLMDIIVDFNVDYNISDCWGVKEGILWFKAVKFGLFQLCNMPACALESMVPNQEDFNANRIMGIFSAQDNRNILSPIYFNFTCTYFSILYFSSFCSYFPSFYFVWLFSLLNFLCWSLLYFFLSHYNTDKTRLNHYKKYLTNTNR